jgi:hypothetical protein
MLSNLFFSSAYNGWTWEPDFTVLVPIALAVGVFFAIGLAARIAVRAWKITWLEFSGWVAFYTGIPLMPLCLFVFSVPDSARHGFAVESLLASILGLLMVIVSRLRT